MLLTRKNLMLYGGLALVALLALYAWIVAPVGSYREDLTEDIERTRSQYGQLMALKQAYGEASSRAAEQARQAGERRIDGTLFAFVERLASSQDVRSSIEYMRPSTKSLPGGLEEQIVEMRLSGVSLDKFVRYLHALETSPEGVYVRRVVMRTRQGRAMDVDLVIGTMGGAG